MVHTQIKPASGLTSSCPDKTSVHNETVDIMVWVRKWPSLTDTALTWTWESAKTFCDDVITTDVLHSTRVGNRRWCFDRKQ